MRRKMKQAGDGAAPKRGGVPVSKSPYPCVVWEGTLHGGPSSERYRIVFVNAASEQVFVERRVTNAMRETAWVGISPGEWREQDDQVRSSELIDRIVRTALIEFHLRTFGHAQVGRGKKS